MMTTESVYKPLFPWFGGKSRVAARIWDELGDPPNYVEPFFGSGAVLFMRPTVPDERIETVNDADGFVSNFWRAVQQDPDAVARYADWPVVENDLHARHRWLVERRESLTDRLGGDPDYCDAKIAGWWVWGLCCWIGGEWCNVMSRQLPHLGSAGQGIHRKPAAEAIADQIARFSERLRRVRVCSGDWTRVCGPSPTFLHGLTGVFLDPPYSARRAKVYAVDDYDVAHAVRDWCLQAGENPLMRVVLCGYAGNHDELLDAGWRETAWTPLGGYASQSAGASRGKDNRKLERLFASPHCLGARQRSIFTVAE